MCALRGTLGELRPCASIEGSATRGVWLRSPSSTAAGATSSLSILTHRRRGANGATWARGLITPRGPSFTTFYIPEYADRFEGEIVATLDKNAFELQEGVIRAWISYQQNARARP